MSDFVHGTSNSNIIDKLCEYAQLHSTLGERD